MSRKSKRKRTSARAATSTSSTAIPSTAVQMSVPMQMPAPTSTVPASRASTDTIDVLCVVPSKRHIVFVTAPATWDASHVVTLVGQREGATNVICCGVRGGDSSIGWHTIEVDPQNALRLVPRSPVVFNSVLAAVGAVSIVGAVLVSWGFLLLAGLLLLLFSLPRNTLSFRFSADGISAHHDEEQRWSVARPHHVVGVRLNLTTDPDAVEYVSLHVRDATVGAPFGAFPLDLSGGPAEALALAGQLEQRGIRCERMCTVNGMPATFSAVTFDAPPPLRSAVPSRRRRLHPSVQPRHKSACTIASVTTWQAAPPGLDSSSSARALASKGVPLSTATTWSYERRPMACGGWRCLRRYRLDRGCISPDARFGEGYAGATYSPPSTSTALMRIWLPL